MICLIHLTEIKTMNYKFLEQQIQSKLHESLFGYVASPLCSFYLTLKNCFYLQSLCSNKCLLNSKLCADCFLRS